MTTRRSRLTQLEKDELRRVQQEARALVRALSDADLEEYIRRLRELVEAEKNGTLSEAELRTRGEEADDWAFGRVAATESSD